MGRDDNKAFLASALITTRNANKVAVIRDGELVEQGTYQELLDRRGFFYNLYMSQFKGEAI